MSSNPKKTSPHPEWALKHKRPRTELRFLKGKYYLYEVSSTYDREKKRAKKISGPLLGSITEERGFIPSDKGQLREKAKSGIDIKTISTKEYGFSFYIEHGLQDITLRLKEYFPENWKLIIALAYARFVHHSCIKNMSLHFHRSYLSELYAMEINEKQISQFLRDLGRNREKLSQYMRSFIKPGDFVLADMTNIFSKSTQISFSKKGYNSDMVFEGQFNLLYIYSSNLSMPVFYRLNPGNVREVKAFKLCLEESGLKDVIVIFDKGFYSHANIETIEKYNLRYLAPLKRNNPLIDYSLTEGGKIKTADNFFKFQDRIIWHNQQKIDEGKNLFVFQDDFLKQKEERDYLGRIESKLEGYNLELYHQKKDRFGTIAMVTNDITLTPQGAYQTYKSRMNIEVMFDGMKNVLDADKTYMQNEEALQGWMFINHIALQWYYNLYMLLKDKDILKRHSVNDMTIHLKEIRKVRINQNWIIEPITASTTKLLDKAGLHIT